MTATPVRIEIVGSFLRPDRLKEAQRKAHAREMSDEEYYAIEDEVIDVLIDRELEAGLKIVTDGEMRRHQWDRDFWVGLNGIERDRNDSGHIYVDEPVGRNFVRFSDRIAYNPEHPFFGKFSKMMRLTNGRAEVRQTLPSPGELYMRILRVGLDDPSRVYVSPETLEQDIIDAYRQTIAELYRLGCRHIQFDNAVWGRLGTGDCQRALLLGGLDPDRVSDTLIHLFNEVVKDRPADLEITLSIAADETLPPRWTDESELHHLQRMLSEMDADAFLLPFDLHDLEALSALQYVPDGKRVIVGLVDGASAGMESVEDIRQAIAVAERYVPRAFLSVSPTCGFNVRHSTPLGLNYETQWAKLALLREAVSGI
ncbi:MAG: hypothetical protein K2K55_01035 [Duncaniella sp.]|nr:hypothetical protein [Duncaniella sp.]